MMKLSSLSTFNMGDSSQNFLEVCNKNELRSAVLESKKLSIPFHVLGEGSNTIFHDKWVNKFIIKNSILGIDIISESPESAFIKIGAGVHWDDVVEYAVEHHLSGIEAMSAIPGSTGATPVQNVGAYGQEIKDVLTEVEVYDVEKDIFETLSNSDCQFAYRDSIFKKAKNDKGESKYTVISITLKLSKLPAKLPQYPGVTEYFEKHNLNLDTPSLIDIRNAIIEIRKSKLPDPSIVPNCGSFFKNTIVCKEHFEAIQKNYPTIPHFDAGHNDGKELIKIPTGWLLEQAGFKDKQFGNFKTHDKNALVMTHIGNGTLDELKAVVKEIQNKVKEMFGVEIEMEVNIVI